jgi:predicted permease
MNHYFFLLKQAWGSLRQKPGFLVTVVVTMGTTLGALLCVLTLGYLLILQPLPYPEQDKLYNVSHLINNKFGEVQLEAFTYPGLIHLYKQQDIFEKSALVNYGKDVLTSLPQQPTLDTGYATPEWFELLDAKLQAGRRFESTEALDRFNPVAILSYQTWQNEFDGRADILEQTVSFSGVNFKVIGVLSASFIEPQIKQTGRDADIWLPWDFNLDIGYKERWGNISRSLSYVGKLKSDYNSGQAQQAITPLVNDIWVENVMPMPFFAGWSIDMKLQPLQSVILGGSENTIYLLLAGVVGLLLIAFTNVANLFMSRTAEQQKNLAIFSALGAKQSHLFKGLFIESTLLMCMAMLLALIMASVGFAGLQHYLVSILPRVNELGLNFMTFSVALFFAISLAVLFALLSNKMLNYRALNSTLHSSGKGTGIQVSKRLRQSLIASQVAIATVLVFANVGLFKQSVASIVAPTGFGVEDILHVSLSISAPKRPPSKEVAPIMTEIKRNLLALPQVQSISQSTSILDRFPQWVLTRVDSNESFTLQRKSVGHRYFQMFDQPLLEGRYFSQEDVIDGNMVMIVNQQFAHKLSPNGSAIGLKMSPSVDSEPFTIVGVVQGIRMPNEQDIPRRVYHPSSLADRELTVKLHENQTITRNEVVAVIKEITNLYTLFNLQRLADTKKKMLFTQYTTVNTTIALVLITLFLAGVGLYGILSYGTQMRRFELGTRMAIGAKRRDLVCLVVKDNAWGITIGMATSVVVMLLLYIAYQDQLGAYIGVELFGMFTLTICAIGSLSMFACYWPLRKYINRPAIHSLRGSD